MSQESFDSQAEGTKTVQGWGLLGVSRANGEASELGQSDHVGLGRDPTGEGRAGCSTDWLWTLNGTGNHYRCLS